VLRAVDFRRVSQTGVCRYGGLEFRMYADVWWLFNDSAAVFS
jgi:hypothetical protein